MVNNPLAVQRPGFNPWVGKISWRRAWQPIPVFLPGKSPWTEKPGKLQFMGLQRVDTNERLNTAQHTKVKTQFVSEHT